MPNHIGIVVVCEGSTILGLVADLGKRVLSILQAALCEISADGEACHMKVIHIAGDFGLSLSYPATVLKDLPIFNI